jgi:UDP-N-acetyl-D-glucosamine dehydrogenase
MEALSQRGKGLKGSRILVLGMAYECDLDDLRESPSLSIIELLQERGALVECNTRG